MTQNYLPSQDAQQAAKAVQSICHTAAGMAIHGSNTENIKFTGTPIIIVGGKIIGAITADAEIDLSSTSYSCAGGVISTGYQRAIFVLYAADGASPGDVVMSAQVLEADKIKVPYFDQETYACVGAVLILNKTGSDFVIGTTDLDAAGVTDTYIDTHTVICGQEPSWA